MIMNTRKLRKVLLILICALLFGSQALPPSALLAGAASNPEQNDQASSFRYEDGLPRDIDSPLPFLRASSAPSPDAWTKIDGVFVNSNLDPILGASKKGVDVSHHQGEIDWKKVKNSGIDFAIIRCGYGQDYESQDDAYWEVNADACAQYGIPFGTYLYSYATSVEKAIGEANHVLRLIEGYDLQYPVYYDMEDASQANLSASALGKIADAFCKTIEKAGYEAAVYANTNWHTTKLTSPVFDQRDRWVAQYNAACKYTGSYNMWQCTSSGRVDGINGDADLNFLIGDSPASEVTDISLSTSQLSLTVGETKSITASVAPKNAFDKSISYTSSDPAVAEARDGTISALSPGMATITAAANDGGANASFQVTVTETADENEETDSGNSGQTEKPGPSLEESEVKKLTLVQDNITLKPGAKATLDVTVTPSANAEELNFTSSKKAVAAVSGTGKITAKAPGKTTITVKSGSLQASCTVIVTPATVTGLTFSSSASNAVALNWKKTAGSSGYTVYYYDSKTKKNTAVKTLSSAQRSYTVRKINGSSLKAGSSYTFKVAAYKTIAGKKVYGSKKSITAATKPKNTVLKTMSRSSSGKIKITWSKVTSATGYVIYLSEKKNSGYKALRTIDKKSTVSYTASGLKKGKTYYIKIATYKKSGGKTIYGGYSNIRSLKMA